MIKRTPFQIQRAVIFALLMRELKNRFGGHWRGVLWLFAEPLVKLAALTWMLTVARGHIAREGYDFPVFLFVAMVPFKLGFRLWRSMMGGGVRRAEFKQIKPMDHFLAKAILESLITGLVFLFGFFILWLTGFRVSWPVDLLAYLLVVMVLIVFGFGLGLIGSVAAKYIPKIGFAFSILSMPLPLASGVFIPFHALPYEYVQVLLYNPFLHLVEMLRAAFLPGYKMLQGVSIAYPISWIVCVWAIAMPLYWLHRHDFVRKVRA